jgi:hypothetical protein
MAEPEKSLGKKIMGFFIKEAEESKQGTKSTSTPPSVEKATHAMPQPQAMNNGVVNSAGTATVDRKFVDHFVKLLEKSNQPGHDYFEFKQALKSMEGLGLDEQKQYLASWASFKAMGGFSDASVLAESANHYVKVLDQDRISFLKDVQKAIDDRVGSLNQELNTLQDDTKAYAKQIMELQEKINSNGQRVTTINGEIQEQSQKINENRDSYDITYQSFVEQLNSDISKIKTFLK